VESYTIYNIQQVVDLGTTLYASWFRGHSKVIGKLVPKVHRPEYEQLSKSGYNEFNFVQEFKRIAPSLHSNLPNSNNHLDWLLLMQHHGTPTRLLDWSQNILTALFFVVSSDKDCDGELWALYPYALNKLSNLIGFPTDNNNIFQYLVSDPFSDNSSELLLKLSLKKSPEYPIAFFPTLNFPRMTFQQSTFTIHPIMNNSNKLENILTDIKDLVCYKIPKKYKSKLLHDLNALGIDHHTMFPDLDHLSKYLTESYCTTVPYNVPIPPKFNNEK
jgi:hypothetical protein